MQPTPGAAEAKHCRAQDGMAEEATAPQSAWAGAAYAQGGEGDGAAGPETEPGREEPWLGGLCAAEEGDGVAAALPPEQGRGGFAATQLQTADTDCSTWAPVCKPHADDTQPNADCWIAAEEAHWQDKFSAPQPTASAADPMQELAQAGTLLLTASHGDEGAHGGADVAVA